MSKRKNKGKKTRKERQYSGIDAHRRQKKTLVPPIMAIPGVVLKSWTNDRLPEMLWAALLISRFGRTGGLEKFRKVAAVVLKVPVEKRLAQPTQSGFATLEDDIRRDFLSTICADTASRNALRPLLLFQDLPARADWATAIDLTPLPEDWDHLKAAVFALLDHQSQEATDCRWLKVLFAVLGRTLHFPTTELVKEILDYPSFGSQEKVRPSIRATEGTLENLQSAPSTTWPASFWRQCLRDTECEPIHTMEAEWSPVIATTRRRIRDVREALARHEKACVRTTDIDAKHDATFGYGGYALAILSELVSADNGTAILGRLGLRTLFECYVTLLYLKIHDDPSLWMAYRQYGSGQAKLAFLKMDDPDANPPASINLETLRQLANEDRWLEFVNIDLGNWAVTDLRKLSEELGVKPDYDRFYPWTSAFTHGNWAAVRNSCFDLCMNPLHRLHRRLRSDTARLGDVVADACELADKILDTVDTLYPGFSHRVTLPESRTIPTAAGVGTAPALRLAPLATVQRKYFEIVDEFFRMATGGAAEEFASLDNFDEKVRAKAGAIAPRAPQAYMYAHEALRSFYMQFGSHLFSETKSVVGHKLVLGGTSGFYKSQFDTVRKMSLYADSILIPDPILPWIESARIEEGFRNVRLLEAAFFLLHLKPLVEADLRTSPIIVFPSYEKTIEERDPVTQARIHAFITRFMSHFLGRRFGNLEALRSFVTNEEATFLEAVERENLFVAPGGSVGQPLRDALDQYEANTKRWRSEGYQAAMADAPKGILALTAIIERLVPHYHLLENAEELSACPMVALPAPWHYFTLICKVFAARLEAQGILDKKASVALDSVKMTQQKLLGNIPLAHLVQMLSNHENEHFRKRLNELVTAFHKAQVRELVRIAPEVCKGIDSLLKEQAIEIKRTQDKYQRVYGDEAVAAYVSNGATYGPMLAPVLNSPDQSGTVQPHPETQSKTVVDQDEPGNSLLGVLAVADND
jgi:hypothetical protein